VGIPKHLEARLARLEARKEARRKSPHDPTLYELAGSPEFDRLLKLYDHTWNTGGFLKDLPEGDRSTELWEYYLHYSMWIEGDSLEDLPIVDRNPELWETICRGGPLFLDS
jgi:hypothetical protein